MKRRILAVCLMSLLAMSVHAQSVKEAWISMPDSLLPYLPSNLRAECVELKEKQFDAKVTNTFGGETRLDSLCANYLQVALSPAVTLQMRMLPTLRGDSIICVVKTFAGPERESEVWLYDKQWQPLVEAQARLDELVRSLPSTLTSRPDSISAARYGELVAMIDPVMVHATLSADDDVLTFGLSAPLLSEDDRRAVASVMSQRKFKWNGEYFNDY